MRIAIIVTGLNVGGAERVLCSLLEQHRCARADRVLVISLLDGGPLAGRLIQAGIPVESVGFSRRDCGIGAYLRLVRLLLEFKPEVLQGWMYHGGLAAASVAGILSRSPGLAVSIHHNDFARENTKRSTVVAARLLGLISDWLDFVCVFCGPRSLDSHVRLGYSRGRCTTISNGIDTTHFTPDRSRRTRVRRALSYGDAPVICCVANWHRIKDHATFLAGCAILSRTRPGLKVLMGGKSIDATNPELNQIIARWELTDRVQLLGPVADVRDMFCAADLVALTSKGESFPMVLVEAIACGAPCVSSDVGECGLILGREERLFKPGDAVGFARCCDQILGETETTRNSKAVADRARVVERFSIGKIESEFSQLWNQLAATNRPAERTI